MNCSTEEALRRVRERRARPGWPLVVNAIAIEARSGETACGLDPKDESADPTGYRPKGGGQ
jgi:hypothetical protein